MVKRGVYQTSLPCVLIAKSSLATRHRDLLAGDENLFHVRLHVERISIGDNHVGGLSDIQRSELIRDTPDFGGIQGDGLQSVVIGEPKCRRETRLVRKIADVVRVVRGE